MTIYEELLEGVAEGKSFSVDFRQNCIRLANNRLVENGKYNGVLIENIDSAQLIPTIEYLFSQYTNSIPNKHSRNKRAYFKAKTADELTEYNLVLGEDRETAQAALEGFVLCAKLSGAFANFPCKGWFWKSENEPDLVILREWIQ